MLQAKSRAVENLQEFLVKVLEFIDFKREHEDLTHIPKHLRPQCSSLANWISKNRGKLFSLYEGRKVYGLKSFTVAPLDLIGFERDMSQSEQWEVKLC